jgi:hypothetical protein
VTFGWVFPSTPDKRVSGERRRKRSPKPGHRTENHRVVSQEVVRQLRAEHALAPKGLRGRAKHGTLPRLSAKFGVTMTFLRSVLYMGIRDEEREIPQ